MPKYHFEIIDGFRLEDPIGIECPTEERAKTVAEKMAKQIASDIVSTSDRDIVVVDDSGDEIFKTAISPKPLDR